MLGIHGQDDRPGPCAGFPEHPTGEHEGFLVGEADDLSRFGGGHCRPQSGGAHLRGKDRGCLGQGGQFRVPLRTHEYLGFIAGRKSGEQGFASLFGLDAQIRRTPAEGLFDQAFDIPSPGQRHDLKQIGMLFDDAQRVDADGARTAQEDDRAGEAVFPFGRRKFCDIADHAFPGAKKGSPETSPVLAFRRLACRDVQCFPAPADRDAISAKAFCKERLGSVPAGLRKGGKMFMESFPFSSFPAVQSVLEECHEGLGTLVGRDHEQQAVHTIEDPAVAGQDVA